MSKCKRWYLYLFVSCVCCALFIGTVLAGSKYTSSLSVDGASLTGKTRYYEAGKNTITIKPTKLVPQEASEYVKLRIMLFQNTAGVVGFRDVDENDMYKASLGSTWKWDLGKQGAGNYFYTFYTKIDGHDYGLVYAPNGNVVMQTQ